MAPCLGLDLPGCGLSKFSPTSWGAYSQEALVELLATIIADFCEMNNGQGVVLIGHSMGCSLSALLASAESPLRAKNIDILGLLAICPKVLPPTDSQLTKLRRLLYLPNAWLDLLRSWDRHGGPESLSVARFIGPGANIELKRLQYNFNVQSKTAVWRRMVWGLCFGNHSKPDERGRRMADLEVWAKLTVPMFLIAGESDKMTSPEEVMNIARAMGKMETPSMMKASAGSTVSQTPSVINRDGMDAVRVSSRTSSQRDTEPSTETTILSESPRVSDDTPNSVPGSSKRRQVLKTSILPEPAAHSLLYDPTTYRTLSGLIQTFLSEHIDSRLSLGWQLQHLSTEGKWDVKNLAKWQAVRPVSEPIAGIFRAMKTLRQVDDVHCPSIFVRKWKGKLKAVVDISHDNPVYDHNELDNGGINYHKFPTVSKTPPTPDEVQEFIRLIENIRNASTTKADAGALIGVHCHYGFNRTGFFICSYLIEKEHYGVQEAIDEFKAQRPPGIRHDHFLDTLFLRHCVGLKRAPTL
ncbi:MAG: hypothetical protein Q9220_002497 [cf. Caloplaca sp. 1 TL-2023]